MNVIYSPTHLQHAPPFEIFDGGEKIPSFETPERMERILTALATDGRFAVSEPRDFGIEPIRAVHSDPYLAFLREAHAAWMQEPTEYEKTALLPATFPPRRSNGRIPKSLLGQAGYFTMDLSAPIVAGTYRAALASAQCALSGAFTVAGLRTHAFALCRPPGHHAGRDYCGGYCYINNAAVAAQWLSERGTVAVLDVDYHAGNGTQDIFYERPDVLTISIHADPDVEYPHYMGYADETGAGAGLGFHRNFPLPVGTDDSAYLQTLSEACGVIRAFRPDFLVVSAGMDIYSEDPLGKIRISTAGIGQVGAAIAALGMPTLVVMEGGYNTAALGTNLLTFLQNWVSWDE